MQRLRKTRMHSRDGTLGSTAEAHGATCHGARVTRGLTNGSRRRRGGRPHRGGTASHRGRRGARSRGLNTPSGGRSGATYRRRSPRQVFDSTAGRTVGTRGRLLTTGRRIAARRSAGTATRSTVATARGTITVAGTMSSNTARRGAGRTAAATSATLRPRRRGYEHSTHQHQDHPFVCFHSYRFYWFHQVSTHNNLFIAVFPCRLGSADTLGRLVDAVGRHAAVTYQL